MIQPPASDATLGPVRYGSRDGSAPPDHPGRSCLVCRAMLSSARARYCSEACKQRAYRLRQAGPTADHLTMLAAELQRLGELVAHTLYACPDCDERFLGERRCPDCNRFCRKLGLGGTCPHCDQPVLLADLLGREVSL